MYYTDFLLKISPSLLILAVAATEYWTFWTLVTISWFFALIVNLLFNDFW